MSQSKLIRVIVKNYVETSKCLPFISKDGITTDQFAIAQYNPLFVSTYLNIRQVRSQIPSIARTVSIAKNLDYYQNQICHEIPSIPDTEQINRFCKTAHHNNHIVFKTEQANGRK